MRKRYSDTSLHRIVYRCRNIDRLSIDYAFRPRLRIDLPRDDYHSPGNLGLSASWNLTKIAVTHASILTSLRSTAGHPYDFNAQGTLSYHPAKGGIRIFGAMLKPRYIFGAKSLS